MADPINILSLYSGSGMLDEAVAAGLDYHGFGSRVLGLIEREAFAAWFLLARMEAETLERAPVWCDGLENLDARPLRGHVDLLTASPPCQPYSSAGKRLGNADSRSHGDGDGPLVHTVRIIAECKPALVFFENVPEWVTGGHFREFGEQLCNLGYDFAPPLFVAAEDVGAPHERERVFVIGWLADADEARWRRHEPERRSDRGATAAGASEELGDAADPNRRRSPARTRAESKYNARSDGLAKRPSGGFGIGREPSGRDGSAEGCDEGVAVAGGEGLQGHEFRSAPPDARAAARGSTAEFGGDMGHGQRGGSEADSGQRFAHEPSGGRGSVADGRSERPQWDDEGGATAGPIGRGGRAAFCPPIFPPGRNDYRRWAALVAGGLDAALMPAIGSGVPVVADGIPIAHSDLLRLGGNAVVSQAAAVAFATLFGEWLKG